MKSPGYFHSELTPVPNDWGSIENELLPERLNTASPFRRLFLATDKGTIITLLSEIGVNLGSVSFTRYDGQIVYRLGDQDTDAPKLLIEKDRFLPMFFSYQLWADQGRKAVTVRFDDYRQVDGGWYPHEVALYAGEDSPFTDTVTFQVDARRGLGVCTSSAKVGPSLSLGRADAVVAIHPDAAFADAAATSLANRIQCAEDVDEIVSEQKKQDALHGIIACCGDRLGIWGAVELV